MIITHVGKFGDFLPSLIIPNFYYKNEGIKTKIILSKWFERIVGLKDFLLLQDFIEDVQFDPYVADNFSLGGQPYKFVPQNIGDAQYYNLGMGGFPTKYLGEMYAEEYGLSYDIDINLNFIDKNFPEELKNKKLTTCFHEDRWDKDRYEVRFNQLLPESGYEDIDISKPITYNLNLIYYSENTILYPNGLSVLCNLCKINYDLVNGSVNPSVYYL